MSPSTNFNPKVDLYIAKAQTVRPTDPRATSASLVHKGCPDREETIKWSRPFFEYQRRILANMSAFKQHCAFGFWGVDIGAVLREAKALELERWARSAASPCIQDLPAHKACSSLIRKAVGFVGSGQYTSPIAARQ